MKKLIVMLCLLPAVASAAAHRSDLRRVEGLKFPNSAEEGREPVAVSVLALRPGADARGYTDLLPYVLRSPDQEEAGSCLYMSLTGIAEWWMAKLHPRELRTPDGPIDFSERYLMNVAGFEEDENGIKNWKTDTIYLFNKMGGTLKNVDYRFTKGWVTTNADGDYVRAEPQAQGAEYGTQVNWIDERSSVSGVPLVKLPRFRREVLFADRESNQWNTGIMQASIVETVKAKLRENKAPVHIIYNHYGYWHATVIVGYDDEADTADCHFVRRFLEYMPEQAAEARRDAAGTKDPAERQRLLARADKLELAGRKAKTAFDRDGCRGRGAFYVRDSIYGDENGPAYDYEPGQKGDEAPYVKSTVLLEYEWLPTMANHATQITVE